MKKYDALYIFVNAAREDAIEPLLEKVSGDITRLGGNVLGSELLGKKTFARVMKKKDAGVYIRVRFELDPSKVAELRSRYALNDEIFRVQILAVDDRREALVVEQNARRKAKAEATIYRSKYQDAGEMINMQVTQLRQQQKEALERLEMSGANLDSAEENLRMATVGFEAGVIDANTALAAQTAWLKAHSEYIDAGIEVQMNSSRLRQALGNYSDNK